jgi:phosphate:Na+ symporter
MRSRRRDGSTTCSIASTPRPRPMCCRCPKAMGEDEAIASQRVLAFSINLEQAADLIDRNLLGMAARRVKRGLTFSPEGVADLGEQVDHLVANTRQAAAVFLSGDETAARALAAQKAAFREIEGRATQAHFERLRSDDVAAIETSSLHLDALRDLKRVNAHLVEAAAYPILQQRGDLLPTRLKPRVIHPQA